MLTTLFATIGIFVVGYLLVGLLVVLSCIFLIPMFALSENGPNFITQVFAWPYLAYTLFKYGP